MLEQLKRTGRERARQEGEAHALVLEGAIVMMESRIAWLLAVIAGRKGSSQDIRDR
jgi:hypothetical protein